MPGLMKRFLPVLSAAILGAFCALPLWALVHGPQEPCVTVLDLRRLIDAKRNQLLLEQKDPDKAAREFQAYIARLGKLMQERAAAGETVVTAQAVITGGKDITAEVKDELEKD
ncbi:MAG: TrbI F-type domain-containing protein [Pseudomonadota bacterium]